jgi:hypothetical protein
MKFSKPYLKERCEEVEGIVYSVVTNYKRLLEDFNEAVKNLEY